MSHEDRQAVSVDVRGLVCPEPVVRTRKALATAGGRAVRVVTDSPEARDNIIRFAERSGCSVTSAAPEAGVYVVEIRSTGAGHDPIPSGESGSCPKPGPRTVVFISSDEMGRGEEKLGRLLMTLFLRTLTELPVRPSALLLANGGVKLALEGSEQLASLATLEQQGVVIRVCGTCLDFFGVKDRVRAGTVSNMYELAEMLLAGDKVMVL